jgi:hypothetical protein
MGAGMRYQPQGGGRRVSGSSPLGRIGFLWTAGAGNVDAISGTLANKRGPNLIGPSGLFADMSSAGYTNTTFSNTSAVGSPYTIVLVLAFQNASVADHILVRQTANVGNFRIQAQSGTSGIGINFVHQGVALGTLLVASPIPGGFNTLNPWVYVCTYDGAVARQYLTDGVNRYTASDTIGYSAVAASTFEFNPSSAPSFPLQLFAVGNRAISADEVRSIQANPWQLFQAPEEDFEVLAGTTYNVSIAETASAVDTLSAILAGLASIAETGTASDASSAALIGAASVAEAGTAADSQAASAVFVATRSDALAAADTTSTGGAITSAAVAETGAATDSTSAIAAFLASVAESGAAVDNQSATAVLNAAWSDVLNAADSQSWGGSVISVSLSEALNALDSQSASAVFAASAIESGAALDSASCVLIANASISEVLAALDSGSVQLITSASIAEALSALDTTSTVNLNFIAAASHILVGRERVTVLVGKSRVLVIY